MSGNPKPKTLDEFIKFCDSVARLFAAGKDVIVLGAPEIALFTAALEKLTGSWMDLEYRKKKEKVEKNYWLGGRRFLAEDAEKRAALLCSAMTENWRKKTAQEEAGGSLSIREFDEWQPLIKQIRVIRSRAVRQREAARSGIDPRRKARSSRKNLKKAREVLENLPEEELKELKGRAGIKGAQARREVLSSSERKAIAVKAAEARWSKKSTKEKKTKKKKTEKSAEKKLPDSKRKDSS